MFCRIAAVAALAFAAEAASAATIDLIGAANYGSHIDTAEATITAVPGTNLLIVDFFQKAVCGFKVPGCGGAFTLTFDFDVNSLMFAFGVGFIGNTATVTLFDAIGQKVGSTVLHTAGFSDLADLSSFGTFRSAVFDNAGSTGNGYVYTNISYEPASHAPSPVALPASLPLVMAGLGALGLAAKRRREA